jgi:hypothetical protein
MSVREIAKKHVREWKYQSTTRAECMVEAAIREAAKPLVEALEIARVGMTAVAVPDPNERAILRKSFAATTAVLAAWKEEG